MFHKKKRRFSYNKKPSLIGRLIRKRFGIEQFCDECSKPSVVKQIAKPYEQFVSGSAVALVYLDQRYGKKNFYTKFGRHTTNGYQILTSELFHVEHLDDLLAVALMAQQFIRSHKSKRFASRG